MDLILNICKCYFFFDLIFYVGINVLYICIIDLNSINNEFYLIYLDNEFYLEKLNVIEVLRVFNKLSVNLEI